MGFEPMTKGLKVLHSTQAELIERFHVGNNIRCGSHGIQSTMIKMIEEK